VALDSLDSARSARPEILGFEENVGGIAPYTAHDIAARIALAEGKPDTALAALREMAPLGVLPGAIYNIEYRECLALAHRMGGRLSEAARVLEELLRIYGGHALSRYELGQVYEEMGRRAEAADQYAAFLDAWSAADEGLPQVDDARRRLSALTADAQ
jgi:tetratricopeptide (TPR) repeat protein